jgi:hypothetical protein
LFFQRSGHWKVHTFFVQSVVGNVLKKKIPDNSDLFQHGCDRCASDQLITSPHDELLLEFSLQATWIRNSILHGLRTATELITRAVGSTFVYHPSILTLTRFILNFTSSFSAPASVKASQASKVEEMLNLLAKYSKDFVAYDGSVAVPAVGTVLVTDTTGAIGSATLAELVKSPKVA